MKYQRFPTLATMRAFAEGMAHQLAKDHPGAGIWAEAGIYTDNVGLSHRPCVVIWGEGFEAVSLRWYAFADEEGTDYMDKRQRVLAREHAERIAKEIQDAIDATRRLGA